MQLKTNRMKIKFILIIAGLCLAFWSCDRDPKKSSVQEPITISGTINNATSDILIVRNPLIGESDTLNLESNSTFKGFLESPDGFYDIISDKYAWSIYIYEGLELQLNVDLDSLWSTLEYHGDTTGINNYIVDKYQHANEFNRKNPNSFYFEPNQFKELRKKELKSNQSFLEGYSHLSSDFVELEKRAIFYDYLNALMTYSYFEPEKVDDSFLEELQTFELDELDDQDYSYSTAYTTLIDYKLSNYSKMRYASDSSDYELSYLQKLVSLPGNDHIKASIANNKALQRNGLVKTSKPDAYYELALTLLNNSEDRGELQKTYELISKLQPGSESPHFEGIENFKGGTTSLKDLKGTYLYIDIWATWCGPCLKELPELKKLADDYRKSSNIQFVSISVDKPKDRDKWRAMVKEKQMPGIQLFADGVMEDSDFMKAYMVNSIPRFIFLDDNGHIIDYDAPRPSTDEIRNLFDSHSITNFCAILWLIKK